MNRWGRWSLAAAMAGGMLALAPSLADPYVMVKWLAASAFLASCWAGLAAGRLSRTALDRPLLALWVVLLLSFARSGDRPLSALGEYPQAFYGLFPLALCTAAFYAAAQAADDRARDGLLTAALAAAVPLTLYGLSQRLWGDWLVSAPIMNGRIASVTGSPVMFGACLALLAPAALHRALEKKDVLGRASLALIAAALALTWARGAWGSAAVACAAYLGMTGRLKLNARRVLAAAIVLPLLFVALQLGLKKRDSDKIRVESLKASLAALAERPALGYGPDAYELASRRYRTDEMIRVTKLSSTIQSSAHDDLVQAAATLGLAGLAAYLWLLWSLGALVAAQAPGYGRDRTGAAVAAGLLGLFLAAKFNPIPPTGLLLGAVFAGLAARGGPQVRPGAGRAAAAVVAAFCLAAAALYVRLSLADARYRAGQRLVTSTQLGDPAFMTGVNTLRTATELNPWSLIYLSARCDVIFRVAPLAPREQGAQLLDKAVALSDDAVRLHPGNPTAHELRATALMLSAAMFGSGRMPEAAAEIRRASELDPTFTFSLRRRMEIDQAVADKADFDAARAVYDRVIPLTEEPREWTRALNIQGPTAGWGR